MTDTSFSPRSALAVGALLIGLAPSVATAQEARSIDAFHRAGQTFVTWRETGSATQFRVYRSHRPILTPSDLDGADFLGTVDDESGRNRGRSQATGSQRGWILTAGGPELEENQGLFVHTVGRANEAFQGQPASVGSNGLAFYAVTTLAGNVENGTLTPGVNCTTVGLRENAAKPRPVLQSEDGFGKLYAHWVGNRDTPYQPAFSPRPSHGFNFRYDPGSAPGSRGLLVRLHAAGQTFAQGFPNRLETPQDVDILSPSDIYVGAGNTLWMGLQTNHPAPANTNTRVDLFTMRRVMWTLDWALSQPDSPVDPDRVYLAGGSMGGMGSIWMASTYPERFAAIFCRNAVFDLEAPDLGNPAVIQSLFGSFRLNLPTDTGTRIFDVTNTSFMAEMDPARDWPTVRTLNGRNDTTVGWSSAVGLYGALAEAGQPGIHYFDERRHFPAGYWNDLERTLLRRTFRESRTQPTLRFTDLSLDGDPGNGDPSVGDPIGTINGAIEYEPEATVETQSRVSFEVFLRDSGALDDAAQDVATVRLLPRRLQQLELPHRSLVHFLNEMEDGTLIDEQLLVADGFGRVITEPTLVTKAHQRVSFERLPVAVGPTVHLGGDRRGGGLLRWTVVGDPGQSFLVDLEVLPGGNPDGTVLGGESRSGILGPDGRATGSMPLPEHPLLDLLGIRATAMLNGTPGPSTFVRLLE